MLRMDVPRRDPTVDAVLRLLSKQRETPRLPTLRRTTRGERLYATVAECIAAKGTTTTLGCDERGPCKTWWIGGRR